jgi:WD40 repeat protein
VNTGKLLRRLDLGNKVQRVDWLRFTPDGQKLATGEGEAVRFWDAASGKHLDMLGALPRNPPGKDYQVPESEVCFSSDGRWLAVSSYGSLQVWDVVARCRAKPFEEPDVESIGFTGAVSFSSDGRLLARYDRATKLFLYEVATGKLLGQLDPAWVTCAFSPRGWQLAVPTGKDGSTLLWDIGILFRAESLPSCVPDTLEGLWSLLEGEHAYLAHLAV